MTDVIFKGEAELLIELPSDWDPGTHTFKFPEAMKKNKEFLLLMTGDGYRLRMYILRPNDDEIEIVPLDWFNDGDFDHAYEWITKIARDPISGDIVGEGFRINLFIMKSNGDFIDWIRTPDEISNYWFPVTLRRGEWTSNNESLRQML